MLTHVSFSAFFSLFQVCLFCVLRRHGCCHETVGQALAKRLLLLVLQLKRRYGTHPQKQHTTVKHRLWAKDRLHSSSGVELTRLFGKVTTAAVSLQVSAGSAVLCGASARLVLLPEFTASSPAAPWLPRFSERQQQSWEITRCYKPTSSQ